MEPRLISIYIGNFDEFIYRKVASTNVHYLLENQLFVKRSQYIRVENPLHKQSEKAYMCFKTIRASTRDYMVYNKTKSTFNTPD